MKTAVYPGTFNPITNGHTDLVERAAGLFDHIIVGVVGSNRQKSSAMPTEQRVELAQEVLGHLPNVEVRSFESLLIQFVQEVDSKIILRGLRTVADFEYEFQLVGHEPRARPQHRNGVSRACRALVVYLVDARARDLVLWWRHL